MADEVETEEPESGPVARRKKGSSKSGYCLTKTNTDEHERCMVSTPTFICSCTCENHGIRAGEEPKWITEPDLSIFEPDE